MKIKIVIDADFDMTEVKKNPIVRILKQLRKLEKNEPLPLTTSTTLTGPQGIVQILPTPPSDHILRF
jgi:hypothetical protein